MFTYLSGDSFVGMPPLIQLGHENNHSWLFSLLCKIERLFIFFIIHHPNGDFIVFVLKNQEHFQI
jgi:hypothetical protein